MRRNEVAILFVGTEIKKQKSLFRVMCGFKAYVRISSITRQFCALCAQKRTLGMGITCPFANGGK
jgi:hypothetical protein